MTNKIYVNRETPIVWTDSGSGTNVMLLNDLAGLAVRVGARKDLGASATPRRFSWRLTVQWKSGDLPTVGEAVYVYLATSDGTNPDAGVDTNDAASDTDHLRNMRGPIGVLRVSSAVAGHSMTVSGVVEIETRYVQPAIYNASDSGNFNNSNGTSNFTLTPVPDEIQDAP